MRKILYCTVLVLLSLLLTTGLFCLCYQLPFVPFELWYGFFPVFGLMTAFGYGFTGFPRGGSLYLTAITVVTLLLTAKAIQLPFASHGKTLLPLLITAIMALLGEISGSICRGKLLKRFTGKQSPQKIDR